ncbi:MAG: hypothetical protein HDS68_03270 [Bacteroidales bacterium]|nr:hypothetical protein [Bacteroidales bacterium]
MKRLIFLPLIILGFLSAILPVSAQDRQDRDQWMNEIKQYRRTFFTKELNLTREQQNKFFPIYEEMEERAEQAEEEARVMERRIAEAPDATDLEYEKATEALYDAKLTQAEIEKSYMDKFRSVLSAKQLFELKSAERQFQREMLKQHQRLRSRKTVGDKVQ